MRARIVLGSAAGESIRGLSQRLQVTERTICLWRRRYASRGLDGLRNRPRSGRPRQITSAKELAVVSATLRKPKAATHWSARRLAKGVGLSAATVHRIWQKYGLQPHRVETFKFSRDPEFDGKLADSGGVVWGPAGASIGAVRGREIADSGTYPPPASAADVAGAGRAHDSRLYTPRHHQPVRRPGGGQRQGPCALL